MARKRRGSAPLLVVAGEPSGDAMGARVVSELGAEAFGVGGAELASAGTELVANIGSVAAMGLRASVGSAPALLSALVALVGAVRRRRPRAALLVGFSEVNARLAAWLKGRDIRVAWYAPPQVWAWRAGRAPGIARAVDRLAVVLPFEAAVWRRAGGAADYVGHPALDRLKVTSRTPLERPERPLVALLPGSRKHEVHAHLPSMLEALERRTFPGGGRPRARVVLSHALPTATTRWARRLATDHAAETSSGPVEVAVADASAAIVASGTATLECATLGVPPVIVYKTDRATHFVARRLVRVPWMGLPNLILGRAAFPELVQGAVNAGAISDALGPLLARRDGYLRSCDETRAALSTGLGQGTAAERVARMVAPWLD